MEYDLLNLPEHIEQNAHKLRRTVPAPNSYFLRLKCPGCENISIIFSNAQSDGFCGNCNKKLARATGGKIKLEERVEYMLLGHQKKKVKQSLL